MSNAEEFTLDDYAAMADEGDEKLSLGDGNAKRDPFEPNHAYQVEITSTDYAESKSGYSQVELGLSIVTADDTLQRAGRHWEVMPIDLPEDRSTEEGEKRYGQLRGIFTRNFYSLLRGIDPLNFSIFHSRKGQGRNATYYDADGATLSPVERKVRKERIEAAVLGVARAIKQGKVDFTGKRFWLVKVKHSNGKLYNNYFAEQPEKFPLPAPF